MKKYIIYLIFIVVLIFCMPIVFTNQFKTEETIAEEVLNDYDYGKFNKIRLLHVETGEVEIMDLDSYLLGVVASEMPANFEIEALKAQAVVARTYTIFQLINGGKHGDLADLCDSSLCCQSWMTKENRIARWDENDRQEYWNKIVDSVNSTSGKIINYDGQPINALFHSNSGGKTELAINVWGGDYPYFKSVETVGEDNYSSYNSEIEIDLDELTKIMMEKDSNFNINFDNEECIKILEYTESGRVRKIRIGNIDLSGIEARKLFGLKSANFDFKIINNKIIFSVIGYGHGVGLSQCGSDYLAKQGKNYEEIIKYYYKDVEISE